MGRKPKHSKKVQREKTFRVREIEVELQNLLFNHPINKGLPENSHVEINDYFAINGSILSSRVCQLIGEWKRLKQELLLANIGIIIKAVAKWSIPSNTTFDDLTQEGMISAMRAIDRFNPELGFSLSTFISRYIFHTMYKIFYNHSKLIREPAYLTYVRSIDSKRTQKNNGKEISEKDFEETSRFTKGAIDRARNGVRTVSIEALNSSARALRNNDDAPIVQIALTDKSQSQEETVSISQLKKFAMDSLKILNRRERVVITKRYGLLDGDPKKLREIGKDLGVSRERIRQIENDALFKLRRKLRQEDVFEVIR